MPQKSEDLLKRWKTTSAGRCWTLELFVKFQLQQSSPSLRASHILYFLFFVVFPGSQLSGSQSPRSPCSRLLAARRPPAPPPLSRTFLAPPSHSHSSLRSGHNQAALPHELDAHVAEPCLADEVLELSPLEEAEGRAAWLPRGRSANSSCEKAGSTPERWISW